jgi:hypothetical protein
VAEDVPSAKLSLIRKEEEPRAATERAARSYQVSHPLLARCHGEDPEVRDAEVRLVESLPPCLVVCEELAAKGGLQRPLPRYRHSAPVSFEEEVRNLPALQGVREAEAEDSIRLDPETVELLALANFDLPAEGQAKAPGLWRRSSEHLFRLDELNPLALTAGHLEGDHDLGDRKSVTQEEAGEIAILGLHAESAGLRLALGGERLRAAVPRA